MVELMAVVAITAILAGLGIATLRQRAFAADVTSAKVVVRSIVAAEEHYRSENQLYFDVSTPGNAGWYPTDTFTKNTKTAWKNTKHVDYAKWQMLGPAVLQPVTFGYKANAGLPTTTPAFQNELAAAVPIAAGSIVEPWYVVQARTDTNGNGVGCMVGAASWTPEVVSINDGE